METICHRVRRRPGGTQNELIDLISSFFISLNVQIGLLPGDILLISCFISYVGCFTRRYRLDLQNKLWMPTFKNMSVSIFTYIYASLESY